MRWWIVDLLTFVKYILIHMNEPTLNTKRLVTLLSICNVYLNVVARRVAEISVLPKHKDA